MGVLRYSHGVEDVFLFIPMLLLSEELGVPLLSEVTTKHVPCWVSGDSWEVTVWGVAKWLFTDLSVVKVLELYSVLLSLPRDSWLDYAYLVVCAKGCRHPLTFSTLSPDAACRCSVFI